MVVWSSFPEICSWISIKIHQKSKHFLNAEEKNGKSVKSEQIYTTLGFGEDVSIKIEK